MWKFNQPSNTPALCSTDLGQKTVKFLGSKNWSDLSPELKAISSPKAFKKAFKNKKIKYPE